MAIFPTNLDLEILGSGGAFATPRVGCCCDVCREAYERGIPYARSGPSTFLHGPDVLFDTPEESRDQLVRANITRVQACFYSHWHPDHVMGRRVWESLNFDARTWPPHHRTTDIYLPAQVSLDFRERLGSWDHLQFLEQTGIVRLHTVDDGDAVMIDGVTITPIRLAEDYVYAFLIERDDTRILLAMDELHGWTPPADLGPLDLAVLPIGVFAHHPLTGERLIAADHPVLREEATFDDTIAIARRLNVREVIFSHIEASDELGHDTLLAVATQLRADGLPATIAFDGLRRPVR